MPSKTEPVTLNKAVRTVQQRDFSAGCILHGISDIAPSNYPSCKEPRQYLINLVQFKKKNQKLPVFPAYVPVLQSYISSKNCSHYMLCPEEEKQLEGPSSSWQVTTIEFQMDLKN